MTETIQIKQENISKVIWDVADILRGPFKKSEYGRVILPFTVLRRLECVMEPTRDAVFKENQTLNTDNLILRDYKLKQVANDALFYNVSNHRLSNLGIQNTAENLIEYINSFNPSICEVFEKFDFSKWIEKLEDSELLLSVIGNFKGHDLGPEKYDNHQMGQIFEDLIRRFSESANDTAGEFFTPRDVVELATELTFAHADTVFTSATPISIYDPTAGAGGFLSVGKQVLGKKGRNKDVSLFGQELNNESYAICRADMTIMGDNPENIKLGDTLKIDKHSEHKFSFCLANPPYGMDWKDIKKHIDTEHADGYAGRFGAGLPRVSDGSMLFLQHLIAKMNDDNGTAGIVLSGSPLFTGSAGSGESEIRRWILENDWLDCIVALPSSLFYNTSIGTYIWILSKNKQPDRKGKVQLINAIDDYETMRKSLGDKRRKISAQQQIIKLYTHYTEHKKCKIFDIAEFGYRKITVERPLQLRYIPTDMDSISALLGEKSLITWCNKNDINPDCVGKILQDLNDTYMNETDFINDFMSRLEMKPTASVIKLLRKHLATHDDTAEYVLDNKGNRIANADLRDYENVPLNQDITTYFKREVLPHVPDAWINESKKDVKDGEIGVVGYEISFNRYFYEYQAPRPLAEIESEIKAVEQDILSLLGSVTKSV